MARRRRQAPEPAVDLTPDQVAEALLKCVQAATEEARREVVEGMSDADLLEEVQRRCEEDPSGFPGLLWTEIADFITETELDADGLKERCKEAGVPLWTDDAERDALENSPLVQLSREVVFSYDMFRPVFNPYAVRDLENYLRVEFNIHS